jgi:hypothetical protein
MTQSQIGRRLNQLLMYAAEMDHGPIVSRAGRRCAAGYFLVLGSSAGLT